MKLYFSIFLGLLWSISYSQWECRSNLAGHLKPINKDSKLYWAAEINGSSGLIAQDPIANGMVFLGLEFSPKNHQFYFEGAYKYWYKYEQDFNTSFSNSLFGLRELSYSYQTSKIDFSLGLQQNQLKDYILVNERSWGASLSKDIGNFKLQLDAATVTKDYARNGTFCANCFLYDIVPTRNFPLGNTWGETNYAAISFNKKHKKKSNKSSSKQDEFETFDEFESFDDRENKSFTPIKSYGGFLYSEFGNYYNQAIFYAGITSEWNIGQFATLKSELIYQEMNSNRALLYYFNAAKAIDWKANQITNIYASYIGKVDIDKNALAMPRFSNLFMGELFRMDMIDMPLVNLMIKHRFTKHKLSFKLAYTRQLQAEHMEELDLAIGKQFFKKKLKATLITGLANSDQLNQIHGLAKLELRLFF